MVCDYFCWGLPTTLMREILYFQLGNYSNYIGTHFWNIQEAYPSQQSGDEGPIDDQISLTERQNPDVRLFSCLFIYAFFGCWDCSRVSYSTRGSWCLIWKVGYIIRVGQLHLSLFRLESFGTLARSNAATGMIDDVASNHGLWYVPTELLLQFLICLLEGSTSGRDKTERSGQKPVSHSERSSWSPTHKSRRGQVLVWFQSRSLSTTQCSSSQSANKWWGR